jgi:hypothetical protein
LLSARRQVPPDDAARNVTSMACLVDPYANGCAARPAPARRHADASWHEPGLTVGRVLRDERSGA